MTPVVSIVIVNYFNPRVIDVCLRTLTLIEDVDYEVVVVDNGSDDDTVAELTQHQVEGRIDTLVLEKENHYFSEGNNIGVRNTNPESQFILLLNSDVGFLRGDWLRKQLDWMEGTAEYRPSVWGLAPTVPKKCRRDIVSIGWTHDVNVQPGRVRPEGWCCLIRREWWREMSTDFPFHYGFEEMVASAVREGAKIGVLSQYAKYLVHREGGSGRSRIPIVEKRTPDIGGWFANLEIESLDFTLGDQEHDSYLVW